MKNLLLFLLIFISQSFLSFDTYKDKDIQSTLGIAKEQIVEKNLKILIWNIYKGQRDNFLPVFIQEAPKFDLIVLQEIDENIFKSKIIPKLDGFQATLSRSFKIANSATGIAILSRFKYLDFQSIQSLDTEPIVNTPKMIQVNYFEVKNNKALMVIDIHALNFVGIKKFKSQFKSLKKFLNKHQGPILFAGDFNTWSKERLEYVDKFTKKYQLSPIKFENEKDIPRKSFLGSALDHAYIRGLKVIRARVRNMQSASDHQALEIEVKFYKESESKLNGGR